MYKIQKHKKWLQPSKAIPYTYEIGTVKEL
jgi:hypothetical protein